jgi:LPXTG-site transpeptidase (sortase) family protein
MKTSKKILILGVTACILGLAGLAPSTYFWYQNNQLQKAAAQTGGTLVDEPTVIKAPEVITGKPEKLFIPSLGLDLEVADGIYNPNTGEWALSNDKVHYALMTVQPNDKQGNTLIYGHYRDDGSVFASLHKIQPGAKAKVTTSNGFTFTYQFTASDVVDPRDTSILDYQGEPQLTLQTCTGTFMQNRQLFEFDLVNVEKSN